MCEDGIEKSISRNHSITVCHHSQSLVIPISDPQDIYFYTILTLIIDSYNINWIWIGLRESNKVAKIRNRYNQVPHLTQDTNGKVTNSQKTPQTRAKRSALSQQVTTKHI